MYLPVEVGLLAYPVVLIRPRELTNNYIIPPNRQCPKAQTLAFLSILSSVL